MRRRVRGFWMGSWIALALAVPALPAAQHGGFAIAKAPYTYHFPRDHAAHDRYRTEWWYFTGHLRAGDGRRFGYELTFFRIGLVPHARHLLPGQSDWRAAQLYPAHFAITDVSAGTFWYAQTLAREALNQGGSSQRELAVYANGWTLRGRSSGGRFVMHLHAARAGNALDLTEVPLKPPAIHGRGGISRKGACVSCASHYYSFTRLRTAGTLERAGVRYRVEGTSWMDHEYGSDELQADQIGWDWFSIQLDDDREIMLYQLRARGQGGAQHLSPQSSGSFVAPDGAVRHLSLADFTVTPTGTWRSPHTDALYPSGWLVRVSGLPRVLRLVPVLADQELADVSGGAYWEGDVRVLDAATGARLGAGYVELTGYAGKITL